MKRVAAGVTVARDVGDVAAAVGCEGATVVASGTGGVARATGGALDGAMVADAMRNAARGGRRQAASGTHTSAKHTSHGVRSGTAGRRMGGPRGKQYAIPSRTPPGDVKRGDNQARDAGQYPCQNSTSCTPGFSAMRVPAPNVVVLAGGANRRFWPLRAKSLLSLCGQSLLERLVRGLVSAGCRRFVVVASPETAAAVEDGIRPLPADVDVAVQPEPRGMGDALLTAAAAHPELLRGPLLVAQAHDVVEPALYPAFLHRAGEGRADGLLTAKRLHDHFPGGYLAVDGERVTALVEKPEPGREPSDLVSLVLHWHRYPEQLLTAIRDAYRQSADADDHYERAIAALLPTLRYEVFLYEGEWQALKYPWHVLGVMDMLLRELQPTSALPEGVSGPVVLEEGVRLLPGARVVGPAWIGAGSVIGTNSLVRGSIIGRHVEVGYGCEVARSYVGDGCTFHHNYVGDSVIDRGVSLGFGTVTGNWPFYPPPVRSTVAGTRLRTGMTKLGAVIGAESRTGIGVLINPGVKIGARTFIGPGIVVSRDVPDGRLLLAKQEITDQPNPFR